MPLSLPRNAQLWLPGLLSSRLRRTFQPRRHNGLTDIFFCIADHFEPGHGEVSIARGARTGRRLGRSIPPNGGAIRRC